MIPATALASLRAALGERAVREDERTLVDGIPCEPTLRPADGEALAAALRELAALSLACVIRGGGSRLALGNPPRGPALALSTAALNGVDELDASEGVCHARAGTPIAELADQAHAAGWELPLDPPGAGSTLGGVLACAAPGPRAHGFGRPRDCVLGLEVVLADGTRTRCGGRVVKNVTGYDLARLYVGSLGTLGVIEGAWLRLRPRPARVAPFEFAAASAAAACAPALAAARRASTRACVIESDGAGGAPARVLVELAGDEASVAQDARWCEAELAAKPAPEGALERAREAQGRAPQDRGLRFRLALAPSRCEAALATLARAGAALLCHPGPGLVYAGFGLAGEEEPSALAAAWRCVDAAARAGGATVVLEAAPAWAKRGRDVFGDLGGALGVTKRLKQRFDPAGRLNPGRFAGGL